MIANAIKNIFKEIGILVPSKDKIPKANAISVAVGIAHPFIEKSSPLLNAMKIKAGTIIPPNAAIPGKVIFQGAVPR
jgi:hypothetical protein